VHVNVSQSKKLHVNFVLNKLYVRHTYVTFANMCDISINIGHIGMYLTQI